MIFSDLKKFLCSSAVFLLKFGRSTRISILKRKKTATFQVVHMNEMMGRRGKSLAPTACLLFFLGFAGYTYYLYNEQYSKHMETEGRLVLLKKKQVSLKSQLQVVYEHRTKLEDALIKERKDHRSTKQDFIGKMKDCTSNLTKAKHEAMNRFNALDTEHKMLKAKFEETNTDYSNLQQQYVRLSEDHQKIVNGQKEDFERLKDTKEKESRSLQERVETLYSEKEEHKAEATRYNGYYKAERNERVRVMEENRKLKENVGKLQEQQSISEKERDKLTEKLDESEKTIYELQSKIQNLERLAKEQSRKKEEEHKTTTQKMMKQSKAEGAIETSNVESHMGAATSKEESDSNVHFGKLKDQNTGVKTESVRERRKPSKGVHNIETTTKLEKENVKSRILGKHKRASIPELKPSDKVQRILIGKNDDDQSLKKEDSIIDEYEVSEGAKEDKPATIDKNREFKGKPTLKKQEFDKETNFQSLITKQQYQKEMADGLSEGMKAGERGKHVDVGKKENEEIGAVKEHDSKRGAVKSNDDEVTMKDSVQDMSDPLDEKVAMHVKEENEAMKQQRKEAADMQGLLDKDRVSQFSKIKAVQKNPKGDSVPVAAKDETAEVPTPEKVHKQDSKNDVESKEDGLKGDSVLTREDPLEEDSVKTEPMGASIKKGKDLMKEPYDSHSKKEVKEITDNGDSFLRKQQQLMHRPLEKREKSEDHVKDEDMKQQAKEDDVEDNNRKTNKDGNILVKDDSIRDELQTIGDAETKGNSAGLVYKRNQIKPPQKIAEMEANVGQEKKEKLLPMKKRRQQLQAPIKSNSERRFDAWREKETEIEEKHNDNGDIKDNSKDSVLDEDNDHQKHVPMKKPKARKNEKLAEEAKHDNNEDEPGDQDLDMRKLNEENKAEDIDSDDESRTDDKDFVNDKAAQ